MNRVRTKTRETPNQHYHDNTMLGPEKCGYYEQRHEKQEQLLYTKKQHLTVLEFTSLICSKAGSLSAVGEETASWHSFLCVVVSCSNPTGYFPSAVPGQIDTTTT